MLYDKLHAALETGNVRSEGAIDQIAGRTPRFVDLGKMGREVRDMLEPLHEEWAGGVDLFGTSAYGLRLYEPGNTLTMHTDVTKTHVISSIVHVDRDVDEPWPIVIEGFDGNTYEVDLQPGEMLFYESAKCLHGRPRPMKGRWYTSLFIHYSPIDWQVSTQKAIDICPESWAKQHALDPAVVPELRLVGTGLYEPSCDHRWCSLSKHWPPSDGSHVSVIPLTSAGAAEPEGTSPHTSEI